MALQEVNYGFSFSTVVLRYPARPLLWFERSFDSRFIEDGDPSESLADDNEFELTRIAHHSHPRDNFKIRRIL